MEDAQQLQDLISSNALLDDAFLGEPNTAAESTAEAIKTLEIEKGSTRSSKKYYEQVYI